MVTDNTAGRVAARYTSKKVTDSGNVVYTYSERQVAKRSKEATARLAKLRSGLQDLRIQYQRDLDSDSILEPRRLVATAVALLDRTLGQESSLEDALVNAYLKPFGLTVATLKSCLSAEGERAPTPAKTPLQHRSCCMSCDKPPTKVSRMGGDLSWYCNDHWTLWEGIHKTAIQHTIDLDGGLAPSKLAFRVIERFFKDL